MAPTIQLYIDDAWLDVTGYVRNEHQVSISRPSGWQAQDTSAQATTCIFVLNNFGDPGPWSYLTPGATYYGKIGIGTPCRVLQGSDVRFWGELAVLRPSADGTGRDAWVEVEARGALGRQSIGTKPIKSPLYSSILNPYVGEPPVAYWPLEDGRGSSRAASGITGLAPAPVTGDFGFGADSDLPGSGPLPSPTAGARLDATIPATSYPAGYDVATDGWAIFFTVSVPAQPTSLLTLLRWRANTGTTAILYDLVVTTDGLLTVRGVNASGVEQLSATSIDLDEPFVTAADSLYGHWSTVVIYSTDGSGVTVLLIRISDSLIAIAGGGAFAAGTLTPPVGTMTITGGSESSPFSIGHVAIYDTSAGYPDFLAPGGWVGEGGGQRMDRICAENGVPLALRGDAILTDSVTLGAQPRGTLTAVLQDTANADGGMLADARDALAVGYVTRRSLCNQVPTLELDYGSQHLHGQLSPADDTLLTRNDVTVTRSGGSSARVVIPDGDPYHHTTEDPPLGIGLFDAPLTVNVQTDEQTDDQAGWYAHLGATKDPRYGQVTLWLHAPAFTANADLTAAALAVDISRTITITGQPSWCPPDLIELMVHGYSETIDRHTHEIQYRTAPARPWEVWILDTGGSTSVHAVDTSATTLRLAKSVGPEWSTTAEPYHISIGGEAMTVTAMATAAPTFIAAGSASHAVNASVTPGLPAGMTPDVGQILLLKAAIRNSGTGVPNTPTDWTRLDVYGASDNVQWFYRYYVTGVAAPTVSFTGGVAGADTSGQIYGFSGLSHVLDGAAVTQLNASAANIAYPELTAEAGGYRRPNSGVIVSGWRQQDWTSVAALAGFAELGEPDTGTGDNQGMVVNFVAQSTATTVPAGSFTVTGGVNGISRGAVFALRPLQTATVTRAVNGVSLSHAAGDAVHAWRPGAIAL